MRRLEAGDFLGRVTFITGPGRGSGKTCLLKAALALLRASGDVPAFLGMGFDGETSTRVLPGDGPEARAGRRSPRIVVEAGELFVSAEPWIDTSASSPEILALLPGRSALGRLALVRARRRAEVVLVGPDSNAAAAEAIALALGEWGARSVLVDGAFDRLTQVASVDGARFFLSLLVDEAGLPSTMARMRLLAELDGLGCAGSAGAGAGAGEEDCLELDGPLTATVAHGLPRSARRVVVEDLTKVFLDEAGLAAFRRDRELLLRRRLDFGGFVLVLRGLGEGRLLEALGHGFPMELLVENPYLAGPGRKLA